MRAGIGRNASAPETISPKEPMRIHGLYLLFALMRLLSIIPPIIGSLTASHIFRKMMMIAQVASVNPIYCV